MYKYTVIQWGQLMIPPTQNIMDEKPLHIYVYVRIFVHKIIYTFVHAIYIYVVTYWLHSIDVCMCMHKNSEEKSALAIYLFTMHNSHCVYYGHYHR